MIVRSRVLLSMVFACIGKGNIQFIEKRAAKFFDFRVGLDTSQHPQHCTKQWFTEADRHLEDDGLGMESLQMTGL